MFRSGVSDPKENVESLNSLEVIKMRLTRSNWSLGRGLWGADGDLRGEAGQMSRAWKSSINISIWGFFCGVQRSFRGIITTGNVYNTATLSLSPPR